MATAVLLELGSNNTGGGAGNVTSPRNVFKTTSSRPCLLTVYYKNVRNQKYTALVFRRNQRAARDMVFYGDPEKTGTLVEEENSLR